LNIFVDGYFSAAAAVAAKVDTRRMSVRKTLVVE